MLYAYCAGNMKKVKHLVELPGAKTKLSLWKADLGEEGSFDEAIKGCSGVFHVATPMDFESEDPEVYSYFHHNIYMYFSEICLTIYENIYYK